MDNIKNKVVVITGASSGIGAATALLLAARGAKAVQGARSQDKLKLLAARIIKAGGEAVYSVTDVRKRWHVTSLVNLAVPQYGKIAVLINNAGVGILSALDELWVNDWEEMITVNLKGTLYGIAAALPIFRKQGLGHFVNTLSTSGLKIVPLQSVYAGTKNALHAITKGLRQEAGDKIRLTIISPGFVQTDFTDAMTNETVKPQIIETTDKMATPPDAVARAIAFVIDQPDNVDVGGDGCAAYCTGGGNKKLPFPYKIKIYCHCNF